MWSKIVLNGLKCILKPTYLLRTEQGYKIIFLKCQATIGFIFLVITSSILKISVAVEQQISRIFQNTPNFLILDDFHSIYCHFLIKGHPVFSRHLYEKIKEKIIFHSLLHKKEHVRALLYACTVIFIEKKFGGSIWCQQLIYP